MGAIILGLILTPLGAFGFLVGFLKAGIVAAGGVCLIISGIVGLITGRYDVPHG